MNSIWLPHRCEHGTILMHPFISTSSNATQALTSVIGLMIGHRGASWCQRVGTANLSGFVLNLIMPDPQFGCPSELSHLFDDLLRLRQPPEWIAGFPDVHNLPHRYAIVRPFVYGAPAITRIGGRACLLETRNSVPYCIGE